MQPETIPKLNHIPMQDAKMLPLFQFPLLTESGIVKHAFTTRLGGVSEGIFESLNLSFSRGDDNARVEENFKRLSLALGVEYESFVCLSQTHTANVVRISHTDAGTGILYPQRFHGVDGMVANDVGVTLLTHHADCVPLYFVDPVHRAIGLSHSGWRGTAAKIGQKTLKKMQEEFHTDPKDVLCAIGPSICPNCYEVGEDVAEAFLEGFGGREREIFTKKENGAYLLNLWKANEIILIEAGILPAHLAVTNVCTCCNPKLLFSHRASCGRRGNLAAVLALSE